MKTPIALFLLLPALLLAQSNGSRQPAPLVLAHVTVIDVTGGPSKPDMTVVIRGDRISDIGKAGEMPVPPDATVVDASGKFLIPGLWDMHVHWYNRDSLTLFTANGVTGVPVRRCVSQKAIAVCWPLPSIVEHSHPYTDLHLCRSRNKQLHYVE